jgi:Cu(I)/Ag(I) efflux system membrane protein CusA/SilA
MEIKSEGAFLVSYVLFDKLPGYSEVEVVDNSIEHLEGVRRTGRLELPPGVFYAFAGTYQQQKDFQGTLGIILPLALFIVFLILYFQFRSPAVTLIVFFQLFCVWGGAFAGMWLIAQGWFLDFSVLGANLRELFHLKAYNLSIPVWIGFLALFGVATDDAVVMATYLIQKFTGRKPGGIPAVRALVVDAAGRRARPCFMTTATTTLALYPILTSIGRGSEVMMPMAIPLVAGMSWELITFYITPVLFSSLHERGAGTPGDAAEPPSVPAGEPPAGEPPGTATGKERAPARRGEKTPDFSRQAGLRPRRPSDTDTKRS